MPLCKQCSRLDFSRYRNRRQPKEYDSDIDETGFDFWVEVFQTDGDDDSELDGKDVDLDAKGRQAENKWMQYDRLLASDNIRRGEVCDLCSLIARHIEKHHVGANERVELSTTRFCSTVDKEHKDRATVRLSVRAIPETLDTFCGPLEPHEQGKASEKQSRTILELQECSFPVPATADDRLRTRKSSSKTVDSRFSGRLMSPKADVGLFSDWINRCGALHGETCGRSIWPANLPQLLKDLLVIDVQRACVVDAPDRCRYVALSYCWGTAPMLRHLLGNSATLRKDGALADSTTLATIRDAIELVKGVGERYLWIDALCIIQDDPLAKQAQLAQMGLIYSLATFTIVAAAGNDAKAGLPGIRGDTRNIDQDILQVGDKILVTVVDGADYYHGVKGSTWETRAWTMQEKILSKKLLIFTDAQVYWSCWNALWLEEVVLENVFKISFQHKPASAGPSDIGFASLANGTRTIHGLYQLLVNAYSERQLSFKSDILNAFSGLCQALGALGNESFHWGLPVSHFDEALCWWLRAGGRRNYAVCDQHKDGAAPTSVPFPSWSWAAWHGSSAGSWISWVDLDGSKSDPPAIIFYSQDTDGQLKRITQSSSSSNGVETVLQNASHIETSVNLQSQWKHEPQIIQHKFNSWPQNSGFLHFWTSIATLYVRREPGWMTHSGFRYFLVAFHRKDYTVDVHLDGAAHLRFQVVDLMSEIPEAVLDPIEDHHTCEVVAIDFVVVSTYHNEVCALAVEWKDGVAYRIGIAEIEEKEWVRLQNREWKMVTLG